MFSTISEVAEALLSRQAIGNDAATRAIAIVKGQVKTWVDLQHDVQKLVADIQSWPDGPVAISLSDSYDFTVALLALLKTPRDIGFPQNDKEDTLTDLSESGFHLYVNGKFQAAKNLPLAGEVDPQHLIFFTSGSTGKPKQIRKHISHLEHEVTSLQAQWGNGLDNTLVISTVSHQHIYGMLFKILWPLTTGRIFMSETLEYWEDLEGLKQEELIQEKGYCLISSPAHLSRYPEKFELGQKQQPMKVFSSAGPLSFEAAQETLLRLGSLPFEILGSTETGGMAWRQQHQQSEFWDAFDVVALSSSDENTLTVKSPFIEGDGVFETNDLVEFNMTGKFLLKGRNDRIVKVEGKRVALPELESFLINHDWVETAAVLVLEDDRKSLSAVITLSEVGQEILSECGEFRMGRKMREEMKSRFDLVTIPRRWRFVDQIPQNTQGKRIFADLSALFD